MRVWLTGGSGFVGRHLLEAFDDVLAPSHAEVDVTDAAALGVELPGLDDQLRRLERSVACTT